MMTIAAVAVPTFSEEKSEPETAAIVAAMDRLQSRTISPREHECVSQFISCGQTLFSDLSVFDCNIGIGIYLDIWFFTGTAGDEVTINLASSSFDPFLRLHEPVDQKTVASDDDSGPGDDARINFRLNQSSIFWGLGVTNNDPFDVGNYSLSLACQSPAPEPDPPTPPGEADLPCLRDNLTACLLGNDGRFEVTVQMRDFANPPNGPGNPFPGMVQTYNGESSETKQSVSFYSFEFGNVEIFVKMVDACSSGFNSFWVFAAGATTAETVILIRDTWTGQVYRIDNPRGQDFFFAPDTQAFKTCNASAPGG